MLQQIRLRKIPHTKPPNFLLALEDPMKIELGTEDEIRAILEWDGISQAAIDKLFQQAKTKDRTIELK